ncbi:AraC family transcriptional regulator [Pontibacter sp. G13]|uniref:AraC family transcriptional regulator n=1 Tax=Pontibacter sp. G13 TaxID=3074898 RepID=UPI0028894DB6|nr:AraC family transcriptional regulator [Pontibacter sp. G13]WNJ20084.1 AraC family transcriptional regulator [Pontibacter sp. G13]
MRYTEISPVPALQDFIHNYWCFEVSGNEPVSFPVQHRTLPECQRSVVLISHPYYRGIRIAGPRTEAFQLPVFPPAVFIGIRFQPWVIWPFEALSGLSLLNDTADAPTEIASVWDADWIGQIKPGFDDWARLQEQTEALLSAFPLQSHALVRYICHSLTQKRLIKEIVADIPASTRVIQRTFKQTTGLTMKQYASNLRQRKLWEDMVQSSSGSMLETILDHGYFDQSHFIHEFQRRMQVSHQDFRKYLNSIQVSLDLSEDLVHS